MMSFTLGIEIKDKKVEIRLLEGKNLMDTLVLSEEYRLSEDLLPSIDKMLQKNKLQAKDIERMDLFSDIGENFTTYRIAKSVINAFNWARNHES